MPGFALYMHLDRASERGYLSFPQVEDAVAGYLSPASPMMRLGQKPLLPTRVARHQAEKAYLAAGQAACTTNTVALLQRYQAKLLTELALSLGEDHPSVAELRRATDLSLRLTQCTSQALGSVMGAAVATQRSLWLSLAKLSDREKAPPLDAPVSVHNGCQQQTAARPAQGAAQAPRQHSACRGRGRGKPQAS